MSPPTALPPAATTAGVPQTGLSILMNGNAFNKPAPPPETVQQHARAHMSPEQQRDLADRERQAKSLAAAGMVAETVGRGNAAYPGAMYGPPTLAPADAVPSATSGFNGIMDSNYWGMDVDASLEDMEMDFAKLFDPAHEMESMQTEGSGWPGTEGNGSSISPSPLGNHPGSNQTS